MGENNYIVFILLGAAISIFIGKYIYEWYAEIKMRNKLASAQIKLLTLIALKLDVDGDKVLQIIEGIEKTNNTA